MAGYAAMAQMGAKMMSSQGGGGKPKAKGKRSHWGVERNAKINARSMDESTTYTAPPSEY